MHKLCIGHPAYVLGGALEIEGGNDVEQPRAIECGELLSENVETSFANFERIGRAMVDAKQPP